jgi:hypothetical protein
MASYYVNNNAQSNGDHEVHKEGCSWLAKAVSTKYLGEFHHCSGAVLEAKKTYSRSNGCKTCSPDCHRS